MWRENTEGPRGNEWSKGERFEDTDVDCVNRRRR